MRCYAPGASTIVVLGIVGYVLLHRAVGQAFAATGLIIGLLAAAVGLAVALAVVAASAAAIRRRRAAAGACTTCRFRCQQALPRPRRTTTALRRPVLVARYDRGLAEVPAPQWPHRPLMLSGTHDHRHSQATRGRQHAGGIPGFVQLNTSGQPRARAARYGGGRQQDDGSPAARARRRLRRDAKNF